MFIARAGLGADIGFIPMPRPNKDGTSECSFVDVGRLRMTRRLYRRALPGGRNGTYGNFMEEDQIPEAGKRYRIVTKGAQLR
jgi:hypothetical protein